MNPVSTTCTVMEVQFLQGPLVIFSFVTFSLVLCGFVVIIDPLVGQRSSDFITRGNLSDFNTAPSGDTVDSVNLSCKAFLFMLTAALITAPPSVTPAVL